MKVRIKVYYYYYYYYYYNGDDDDKYDKEHWYGHVPKTVETSHEGKVIILWNYEVQTNRTIPNNKPDIIIWQNEEGTYMLIDAAISGDINVIKRKAEDILKYKDLTKETEQIWNVKIKYRISWTIRRTFFPQKYDLKSTCILYAEGNYIFPNL